MASQPVGDERGVDRLHVFRVLLIECFLFDTLSVRRWLRLTSKWLKGVSSS